MEQINNTTRRPEYAIAFRSIRAAKNLTATLIILCILLQIGATIAVHFARVLDGPVAAAAGEMQPTTESTEATASTQPADQEFDIPAICQVVMEFGLPGTRFASLVLCLLLMLMVMFAVKLSLVERIGGVAGFMSSFNWSMILLMMLIPWRPILGSSLSCGALFTFSELMRADAMLGDAPSQIDQVIFYARFIAYPCVALFTCLIVQAKFAKGYSAADFRLDETKSDSEVISERISPIQ